MAATLRTMGEHAVLVELDALEQVVALDAVLRPRLQAHEGVWAQVQDLVPAARTLLVIGTEQVDLARIGEQAQQAAETLTTADSGSAGAVVQIHLRYDGPDLDDVAEHTGRSRAEVIGAHTGQTWRVAFFGFAPGFAYLVGEDDRLQVPRRQEPRTRVPAGSVGLAGEFSSVYPRESPGGWQLIGRTEDAMWDTDRDPPALLSPGNRVRFVDLGSDS